MSNKRLVVLIAIVSVFGLCSAVCFFCQSGGKVVKEKVVVAKSKSAEFEIWEGRIIDMEQTSVPFRQQLSGSDWGANYPFMFVLFQIGNKWGNNPEPAHILISAVRPFFNGRRGKIRIRLFQEGKIYAQDFLVENMPMYDKNSISTPFVFLEAEGVIMEFIEDK